MVYKIVFRKCAYKDLKRFSKDEAIGILQKIDGLSHFPHVSNVKKLTNFLPEYRLRIGNIRILFDIEKDTIFVGRIVKRKDAYC